MTDVRFRPLLNCSKDIPRPWGDKIRARRGFQSELGFALANTGWILSFKLLSESSITVRDGGGVSVIPGERVDGNTVLRKTAYTLAAWFRLGKGKSGRMRLRAGVIADELQMIDDAIERSRSNPHALMINAVDFMLSTDVPGIWTESRFQAAFRKHTKTWLESREIITGLYGMHANFNVVTSDGPNTNTGSLYGVGHDSQVVFLEGAMIQRSGLKPKE